MRRKKVRPPKKFRSPLAIPAQPCYNILNIISEGRLNKMGASMSLTKKQKLLAGVVCSLIVLRLADKMLYAARSYSVLPLLVLGGLSGALVGLKFLLPNWKPHKKWLGWLLGVSLVTSPLASIAYLAQGRSLMLAQMAEPEFAERFAQFDEATTAAVMRAMGGVLTALIVIAYVAIILLSPAFHLLRGLIRKKSTEKTAGVFSLIALTVNLLPQISAIARGAAVWDQVIISVLISVGFAILYFTWPVLTRPILEKIEPEKENTPMQQIRFERTAAPKQKPDQSKLGFGNYFTDHMFLMNYDEGQGWHDPRIVPYGPIALDPSAMCLHYGQEVFEGLKAYCGVDGKIRLFRPEENMARLNLSNERLCIPPIDEAFAVHATEELVKADRGWIPTAEGTSLYIRPFIFAVDPQVGVHPAAHLLFCIILSPVGAYYPEGLNPVKIFVEEKYVRAVKGGLGFTKAAANYASSLKAQQEAQAQGYSQVLWLDGVERKYIEEVGTMNVFFAFENEIVTPALQGSILGGITRKSCIDILRGWGYTVNERPLALEEVVQAAKSGALKEAFGSGTAAVVSPIGALACGGETLTINNGEIGAISQKLYDELTGIQWGKVADTRGWTKIIA